MIQLEPKDVCEIVPVDEDVPFREFLTSRDAGIAMVPEPFGNLAEPMLRSDAGDFAKWLAQAQPDLRIAVPPADRLVLRSSDIWLPLVFLAQNVALPFYLGLVTNYVYDRMKGALRGERPRVHLSAEFLDGETGSVKRFNFEGDADVLKDVVKAVDLNEFFDS